MNPTTNFEFEHAELGSKDYQTILTYMKINKQRTSRDVLCLQCWQLNSFWQHKRHLKYFKDHSKVSITAKDFYHESQLLSLAKQSGNYLNLGNGK
jgi:hypothetical protein